MTLWQFNLLIGGELLLLAAVGFFGAKRVQARAMSPQPLHPATPHTHERLVILRGAGKLVERLPLRGACATAG